MTFEKYGYQYLQNRDVPYAEQIEIMDVIISGDAGTIISRMIDEHIESYPPAVLVSYRTVLSDVAGEWLDNNHPFAPYRKNFMERQNGNDS